MKQLSILLFITLMNGISSCTNEENMSKQISACVNGLSESEKSYFLAIGFYDYKKIKKWNDDIRVTIKGNDIRDGDRETIDTLIKEVAQLISPLRIYYSSDPLNANLVFVLDKDMSNPNYAYGQANPKCGFLFNQNSISYSDILIFPTSKGMHRKRVMYHEMMHALGMNHPKFASKPAEQHSSVIMPYNMKSLDEEEEERHLANHYKFTALDRKLIKTLYSPCLPPGLKRK